MNSTICRHCRLALRRKASRHSPVTFSSPQGQYNPVKSLPRHRNISYTTHSAQQSRDGTSPTTPPSELSALLSKPTWSVRSLLPPPTSTSPSTSSALTPIVTPKTLRHLLRLSALPPPSSLEEEARLISTLSSQLSFVRAVQRVDTRAVEPLRAIRDETAAGRAEQTVTLDTLREVLTAESIVGHSRRPRRRGGGKEPSRGKGVEGQGSEEAQANGQDTVEDWNVLGGASETAGRYFVVRSGRPSDGRT